MPQQYIDQPQLDPEGMPMPGAQAGMDKREALFRQGINPNTNEPLMRTIDASMQDQAAAAPAPARRPPPRMNPRAVQRDNEAAGVDAMAQGPLPPRRPAAGAQSRDQVAAPPAQSAIPTDGRSIIEIIMGVLGLGGAGLGAAKGGQYILDRLRAGNRAPDVAADPPIDDTGGSGVRPSPDSRSMPSTREQVGEGDAATSRRADPMGRSMPRQERAEPDSGGGSKPPGGRPISKAKTGGEDTIGGVIDRSMEDKQYPDESKRAKSAPRARPVSKVPTKSTKNPIKRVPRI